MHPKHNLTLQPVHGNPHKLPPIGLRIIKSSVAVFLCYMIYLLRGKHGIVFYSQLAVLWCIQPYVDTSLKKALQRTVGTFIGAAYGLLVILPSFYLFHNDPKYELLQYAFISFLIIPIIYTTVLINKKDASYFSCVVFLSIVVIHIEDTHPVLFVWDRVSDTMIGIIVGVIVNSFHLPRQRITDILFVSGLDDTLLFSGDRLSPFSKIELNQMIADGANFTLSTMRTPASLLDAMKEVHLQLPVIAMDGAVLYDIKTRKYLKTYVISYPKTCELVQFIRDRGFHCFINVILQDMLVIYHRDFQNDAERDIYSKLYSSPHRNYLYRELPEGLPAVYLMLISPTSRTKALYHDLETAGYTDSLKILHYPSDDYPGYSYIKIYNKNAQKELMMDYLKTRLSCHSVVTFGSIEGKYDYVVYPNEQDLVVKQIKHLFEPVINPFS